MIMVTVHPIVLAVSIAVSSQSGSSTAETYVYDARGQLVEVQRSGGAPNGILTEYEYDAAYNRVRKKVTGA